MEVELHDRGVVLSLVYVEFLDFVLQQVRDKDFHNRQVIRELELDGAVPAEGLIQTEDDRRRVVLVEVIIQAALHGFKEDVRRAIEDEPGLGRQERCLLGVLKKSHWNEGIMNGVPGDTSELDEHTVKRRVEQDRSGGNVGLQERARVRHDCPSKLMLALILFGIGGSSGTEQRNPEDVPAAREPVLRLGEDGDTITVLAQVRIL